MPLFAFQYFMGGNPDLVRETVPAHVGYWQGRDFDRYEGGPFADRSGGLIVFAAGDAAEARAVADGDPFMTAGLLSSHTLKEWNPE